MGMMIFAIALVFGSMWVIKTFFPNWWREVDLAY